MFFNYQRAFFTRYRKKLITKNTTATSDKKARATNNSAITYVTAELYHVMAEFWDNGWVSGQRLTYDHNSANSYDWLIKIWLSYEKTANNSAAVTAEL